MSANTAGPRKPAPPPTDAVLEELHDAVRRSDDETTRVPTRALEGVLADLIGRRRGGRIGDRIREFAARYEDMQEGWYLGIRRWWLDAAAQSIEYAVGTGSMRVTFLGVDDETMHDAAHVLEHVCKVAGERLSTQQAVLTGKAGDLPGSDDRPSRNANRVVDPPGPVGDPPYTFGVTFYDGVLGAVGLDNVREQYRPALPFGQLDLALRAAAGTLRETRPPVGSAEPGLLWVDAWAAPRRSSLWRKRWIDCTCGARIVAVFQAEDRIVAVKHEDPCHGFRALCEQHIDKGEPR